MEHKGSNATFLDLDISIDKGKFIYKMFDKRDAFKFHIARMLSIRSNIPKIIFYSSRMSESVKNLLDRMIKQGGSKYMLLKEIKRHTIDIHRLFKNVILWLQIL